MTDEELEAQRIAELSKPEVAEAWTKELAGIVHFARARYDELNPEQRKRLHEMEAMLSRRRIATCHNLAREEFHREDHQGVCVTINSDDPAYFGGYINENFLATHHALGLTRDEIHRLARNSFEASFLSAGDRRSFIDELDVAVRAGASPSPDVGGG